MDKAKSNKGTANLPTESLESQVKEGVGKGRDDFVWVRDDGAVCFGDECAVIKPGENGVLDLTVKPDRCGQDAGSKILDHLVKTAGRGVRITIPSIDKE